MSENVNTQFVQRAYRNVETGDIASLLDQLAEDVLWELPEMANVPFAGTWRGRQQVRQFFDILAEAQDVVEFQPEDFFEKGNIVVVLGHFTMQVKATGNASRSAWVHVWTIDGNSVTRVREYVDTLAVSRAYSHS